MMTRSQISPHDLIELQIGESTHIIGAKLGFANSAYWRVTSASGVINESISVRLRRHPNR